MINFKNPITTISGILQEPYPKLKKAQEVYIQALEEPPKLVQVETKEVFHK